MTESDILSLTVVAGLVRWLNSEGGRLEGRGKRAVETPTSLRGTPKYALGGFRLRRLHRAAHVPRNSAQSQRLGMELRGSVEKKDCSGRIETHS